MRPSLTYRPDIDGLRAVAVLSVVAHHVAPTVVRAGFVGVDIFFVISGYLITRIVYADATAGRFSFTDFYWRRGRRIVPALLVVLTATWCLGAALLTGPEFLSLGKHVAAAGVFGSNIQLWREVGYFDSEAGVKPLLHLWSLGVEEQFYLAWPALLLLVSRRPRSAVVWVLLLAALSLAVSAWSAVAAASAGFFLLPARLWELLAGGALAIAATRGHGIERAPTLSADARRHLASALSWIGVALLVASFVWINEARPYPGTWAMLPVISAVAFIAAGPNTFVNRVVLGNRWAVGIGLISYPLYLWHWPLLSMLDIVSADLGLGGAALFGTRLFVASSSVLLAWLTHRLVERPVQRLATARIARGERLSRQTLYFVAPLLAVACLGAVTVSLHGIPARYAGPLARDEVAVLAASSRRRAMARYPNVVRCSFTTDVPHPEQCLRSLAAAPRVALLGDSHAEAAFPGLSGALPDISVQLMSHTRCPPLLGSAVRTDFTDPTCVAAMEAAVATLAQDRSVRTVVLVSRGPLYLTAGAQPARPPAHRTLGADRLPGAPRTNPARLAIFRDGLRRTVVALTRAGKEVILVHDVPELNFRPRDCVVGRPLGLRAPIAPCSIARATVDERNADYRATLGALAATLPGAHLFDAVPVFCDQHSCAAMEGDALLYADDNHMSLRGSERLGASLGAMVRSTLRD
ncbi:MAG: acyltransferase [Gemmatimonadetes bacterium]|nr:acyltransferase [Gemmatimonadota bacterium]